MEHKKLKELEKKVFPNEVALFDALKEVGIADLGNYRSGGRNRELARKEVQRFLEYKDLIDVDKTATSKRAKIITCVYDTPKEKEDGRGTSGRYIDKYRPLLVELEHFRGTRVELFNQWGLYEKYKPLHISADTGHIFNPWRITFGTLPGEEEYKNKMVNNENSSFKTALNSMQNDGILMWSNAQMYTPMIETYGENNSINRAQTKKELIKKHENRLKEIQEISKGKNCVLSPELYINSFDPDMCEVYAYSYYDSGEDNISYEATPEQERWYENYKLFLRQKTVQIYEDSEEYKPIEALPSSSQFWSMRDYRNIYRQLDHRYKHQLLGWKAVWGVYDYTIIDQQKAEKYKSDNPTEQVEKLRLEFLYFMNEGMDNIITDSVTVTDEFLADFAGFGVPHYQCLRTYKSSIALHKKLMGTTH